MLVLTTGSSWGDIPPKSGTGAVDCLLSADVPQRTAMATTLAGDAVNRLLVGPLSLPVRACTLDEATRAVVRQAATGSAAAVHLVNAFSVVCAHEQPAVGRALQAGHLSFTDGMPLVWLARRLGAGSVTRVYGPDLLLDVIDKGRGVGLRHYFYGGTPDAVDGLVAALRERFPGVVIAGHESPPFRPLDQGETAAAQQRIRASRAHVVWVGLGTPKQDVLVHEWAPACEATLVAVGAAFDFIGGTKRQAPRWMRRSGFEWLFRLVIEPRRLAHRYLVGNVRFLRLALRKTRLDN